MIEVTIFLLKNLYNKFKHTKFVVEQYPCDFGNKNSILPDFSYNKNLIPKVRFF